MARDNNKLDNSVKSNIALIQDTIALIDMQKKQIIQRMERRNTLFKDSQDLASEQILSKANNDDMKLIDNLIQRKIEIIKVSQNLIKKESKDEPNVNPSQMMDAIRKEIDDSKD